VSPAMLASLLLPPGLCWWPQLLNRSRLCRLFSTAASSTIAGCSVDFLPPPPPQQPAALLSPPSATARSRRILHHSRRFLHHYYLTHGMLRVGMGHVPQWDIRTFLHVPLGPLYP
jgi:hypothetical protein